MLSKSATMMLGLINQKPQNEYEIIKNLEIMNVKWWYNIADSTVYATLRTLDNKGLLLVYLKKRKYATSNSLFDKR